MEERLIKFLYKESLIELQEKTIEVNKTINQTACEINKIASKIENLGNKLANEKILKSFKNELIRNIVSVEMTLAVLNSYTTAFKNITSKILDKK